MNQRHGSTNGTWNMTTINWRGMAQGQVETDVNGLLPSKRNDLVWRHRNVWMGKGTVSSSSSTSSPVAFFFFSFEDMVAVVDMVQTATNQLDHNAVLFNSLSTKILLQVFSSIGLRILQGFFFSALIFFLRIVGRLHWPTLKQWDEIRFQEDWLQERRAWTWPRSWPDYKMPDVLFPICNKQRGK